MPYKTVLVGISGPSSSGKTTLARLLQTIFSGHLHSFIIHEDDFYVPDNRIPVTISQSGDSVQDWDTLEAIDIRLLERTLAHVKSHGELPPRLQSIQGLNEKSASGVSTETVSLLQEAVSKKLSAAGVGASTTLVFLEGFLLYSPQHPDTSNSRKCELKAVHDHIDLRLFLPAPYDIVKSRRETRSGYATAGPAPPPQQRSSMADDGEEPDLLQSNQSGDWPQQNFWTDPPGYVDDVVWPRYVRSHAWLLAGEGNEDLTGIEGDEELVRAAGQAMNVRADAGVNVAPGGGQKPMAEILQWAVDEVIRLCETI